MIEAHYANLLKVITTTGTCTKTATNLMETAMLAVCQAVLTTSTHHVREPEYPITWSKITVNHLRHWHCNRAVKTTLQYKALLVY